jgi:hypothetical protein
LISHWVVRSVVTVMLGLLVAGGVAACGDNDNDEVSQAEIEAERREAAEQARQEERLKQLEKELKEAKKEAKRKPPPAPSPSPTPSPSPAPTPSPSPNPPGNSAGVPAGYDDCGSGVYAESDATSCPFAFNVAEKYWTGDTVFTAYSPTTNKSYEVHCDTGSPAYCESTTGAGVYIID